MAKNETASVRLPALSRRTLLGSAALLGASQHLGMPFIANAHAAEPMRIGMLWAKTGPSVDQAEYLAQGCLLAVEQRKNTLLGQPVEVVWLEEASPQGAQQNAQRLIEEYKAIALIGGSISSFALATSAVAKRARVPYIAANAAAADLTGKACNRYTFRPQAPADVQARVLAPYLMERGKKWYLLTASYAFGQDIRAAFTDFAKRNGITIVGADEVPVNTPDYSSFILKIRRAAPDVVIGGVAASDLTTFLKQWNELGMRNKIGFAEIAIGDTDIWGVGPQAATGTFTKTWYYNNPENSPADKGFAAAYQAKHGRPPADKAWMGWSAMRSLLDSIEAAKTTESAAVVRALETWHERDGDLEVRYRDWDHQMLRRILVVDTKPSITDKWDYFDTKAALPRAAADVEPAYGDRQQIGCTMDPA